MEAVATTTARIHSLCSSPHSFQWNGFEALQAKPGGQRWDASVAVCLFQLSCQSPLVQCVIWGVSCCCHQGLKQFSQWLLQMAVCHWNTIAEKTPYSALGSIYSNIKTNAINILNVSNMKSKIVYNSTTMQYIANSTANILYFAEL